MKQENPERSTSEGFLLEPTCYPGVIVWSGLQLDVSILLLWSFHFGTCCT